MVFNYTDFAYEIIYGLTFMIKKIGLYGYNVEWDSEFPLSLYLKLIDSLNDKELIQLKYCHIKEDSAHEGKCSDIQSELKLFNKMINE